VQPLYSFADTERDDLRAVLSSVRVNPYRDPIAFAEPFGMHTETVDAPEALAPALERALKAVAEGTTAVVDVLVTR